MSKSGVLSLTAGGKTVRGWNSIRITRGCERIPSDFDFAFTERYPGTPGELLVDPGDPCTIRIDDDRVMTGYVDRYLPAFGPQQHPVRVMGRSMSQDIVDSSAVLTGMQVSSDTVASIAQRVAGSGITIRALTSKAQQVIPQFNVTLNETPFQIIEQLASYLAFLVYDDTDGTVLLADVGSSSMSSGFVQGVNVQNATATFSMDERFREYIPVLLNTDALQDLRQPGMPNGNSAGQTVIDDGVPETGHDGKPRNRKLIVVSEQVMNGENFAVVRARWERNRRFGRSRAVSLITSSWRDSAGDLWRPNAYAPLDLPALRITPSKPWIISQVSFIRDPGQGTIAEVILMPEEGFLPAPVNLQPYDPRLSPSVNGSTPTRQVRA